jgi:hypothetical protein
MHPLYRSEHINRETVRKLHNLCSIIIHHECQVAIYEYLRIHVVNSALLSESSKLRTLNETKTQRSCVPPRSVSLSGPCHTTMYGIHLQNRPTQRFYTSLRYKQRTVESLFCV